MANKIAPEPGEKKRTALAFPFIFEIDGKANETGNLTARVPRCVSQ
jgi:hypothetical protein